jgi:S1-C subfamily serine protease
MSLAPARALAAVVLLPAATPVLAEVPTLDPLRGVMTTAPLLEATSPAVVNISVRQRLPGQDNPLYSDPFFRRFFDLPDRPPQREAISAGSGVIVDATEGCVLTNDHVVDGAADITVTLKDRRHFSAVLIGSDPQTDIALLRIEAEGLSDLPLADSDQLKVGDLVFAIGNPFGLRADDVVLAVNRRRVRSLGELQGALRGIEQVAALNIQGGNTRLFLVLR